MNRAWHCGIWAVLLLLSAEARADFAATELVASELVASDSSRASISGWVRSGDTPLASADVLLRDPTTGLDRRGTATSDGGRFHLSAVLPGRYELIVSYVGYEPYRLSLRLQAGEERKIEAELHAATLPQPGVIVTANRIRPRLQPVTATALARQDLERAPSMKDLPVILAQLPSVTWYSENGNGVGYSYLRMRGFDQRRVAVAINGIPQNDPEEFNVFWINFFDLQGTIDDIQVQRGAGSSFYGPAAIGGAVNIRAMPYRPYAYARAEVGYGSFDTRRLTAEVNSGLLGGRYVAYGRLSRLQSDGYRDWSWAEFWRFFAGVTRYGDRSTLTLQAYGGPQRDALAYAGIPKAANRTVIDDGFGGEIDRRYNFSALTRDVEDFHQPHVELFHELKLNPDTDLHQTLFWIKGEGYFDFGGTFRSADYLGLPAGVVPEDQRSAPLYESLPAASVLFRAVLDQWQIGWLPQLTLRTERSETRIGAEGRLHRSVHWGRIQESDGIPGVTTDRVYSYRGEKAIVSAFASHLMRLSTDWALQADVQGTWRQLRTYDDPFFGVEFKKSYVFVNPRVGLTYRPEKPFSAYASIALANREPRMKTHYDGEEAGAGAVPQFVRRTDGSFDYDQPLVGAEQLIDVEVGASYRQESWRVAANVFHMGFRDEIVPSGGIDQFGVPRTGNAERTRHVGLELEAGIRLLPGIDLTGNATVSRNRFVRFTEYETAADFSTVPFVRDGNPIAGFPDRILNAALVGRRSGFTTTVSVSSVGRQYIDNSAATSPDKSIRDDLHLDPYTLVDFSIRYGFSAASPLAGIELAFDVNNVLDARSLLYGNVSFGQAQFFPSATRHVFAGIRYTVR